MKKIIFTLLPVILTIILIQELHCETTITQIQAISVSPKFPFFETTLFAEQNNAKIALSRNNIVIREMNYATIPDSVIDIGNNNFRVKWSSKLQNRFSYAKFFVTFGSEVATADFDYPASYSMPFVRIVTPSEAPIIYFPTIYGSNDSSQININFKPTNLDVIQQGNELIERPVKIDSIRTHTPYFSYRFYGNGMTGETTPDPDPFDAYSVEYRLFLYFKGHTSDLYQDKLSIYYNGGQVAEVDLIANSYKAPIKTQLKVTKPAPGEILTPCFRDTIRWTGAITGLTTTIQFSDNGGITWRTIGTTLDSFFVWTVPYNVTETALIKVYQNFARTSNFTFSTTSGFNSCRFYQDATYLISSTNDGRLREYNQTNGGLFQQDGEDYSVSELQYPDETAIVTAVDYISDNPTERKFVAVYCSSLLPEMYRKDKISFFASGNYSPFKTIDLNFKVANAASDSKYRYFAVLPQTSNQIIFYSAETFDSAFTFIAEKPIRNFKFVTGSDSILISLESNEFLIYNFNTKQIINTLDYNKYPLTRHISLSADGKFLSFVTEIPEPSGYDLALSKTCQTHVFELDSMRSVRNYYGGESEARGIDFNPTATRVIKASKYSSAPAHIMIYNLSDNDDAYSFNVQGSELAYYNLAGEGHNAALITDASSTAGKMTLTKFPYPESDEMDGTFSIRLTQIDIKKEVITDRYIATRLDTLMTDNFVNVGDLPIIISNAYFKYGTNFSLVQPNLPDTLFPNDKLEIAYIFNPIDTGLITDTLIIETCAEKFFIPFVSRGLPRNLALYDSTFDFGEVCIGESVTRHLKLFRNADPVSLNINYVFFEGSSNFRLAQPFNDTTIAAGEDFYIDIVFTPLKRGLNTATCVIMHSKQYYMTTQVKFTGTGLGSDIELSNQKLYFIPEYPARTVTIKNLESTPFTISEVRITPENSYLLRTQLPLTIGGGGTDSLTFELSSEYPQDATFFMVTDPCVVQSVILAGAYSDNVQLKLIDTQADPRGMATINVSVISDSNSNYNGQRFYNGEFSVNASIFLPDETNPVTSDYGTCKLTKNEILEDKRIIGFRVEGILPDSGIIASIYGYAGLTYPTQSPLTFIAENNSFGSGTNSAFYSGTFSLINLCGNNIVIPAENSLKITSIYPNPIYDALNVSVNAEANIENATLEIYNYLGILQIKIENLRIQKGTTTIPIATGNLQSGTYNGILRTGFATPTFNFIKITR